MIDLFSSKIEKKEYRNDYSITELENFKVCPGQK